MGAQGSSAKRRSATVALVAVFVLGIFGLTEIMRSLGYTPSVGVLSYSKPPLDDALQAIMTTRVCGSPAVDGYAHVDPQCLRDSPASQWWRTNNPDPHTDLVVHIEHGADYDGIAVGWGIGNTVASIEECAAQCRDHVMNADDPLALPCNSFVFCAAPVCWEPDAHSHSGGDCWLKFTEAPASPEVNMRGKIDPAMKARHPDSPEEVQWHSGVLLPRGTVLTNGTWSPRYEW